MTDNELHVVFGTGPVGLAVMDDLVRKGTRVRMVNRSGRADVAEGVEVVGGDAADSTFTREVSAGASVVYFALNPPYNRWPELFPSLQAGVLEGAVRAGMSRELMESDASGKVRVAIGRASDFFGPRVLASAAGKQIFGRAVEGKSAQVAGDPDQPHTYTYAPDIGKGLVVLGEREEALGRAWHLPSPETVTTRRFVEMIFEEAGGPARIQTAPKFALRVMGLFNPPLREMIEMLYEFEEPFVVDHSDFEQAFGMSATPLKQAIGETLRWYRRVGGA